MDDLSTVCPPAAAYLTAKFVAQYRQTLADLNIGAAPEDPGKKKAFDGSTSGEVLGVVFDSTSMTWHLPINKLVMLVSLLLEATKPEARLSLHDVEVLHGKLSHFMQHAPPLCLLTAEVLVFLRELLKENGLLMKGSAARSVKTFPVPFSMKHDLKTAAAIVRHTMTCPLPILEQLYGPCMDAYEVFTDASGHLISNPSMGIYVPPRLTESPLVASLAFPRSFLHAVDDFGQKGFNKTTILESLGYLAAICLDPMRFAEREMIFRIDNMAAVTALKKGHSRDDLATTIVRAARVVAAGIGASIFSTWERRRSSRGSQIADDLTHNRLTLLTPEEVESYIQLNRVSFPSPILQWMAKPCKDQALGRKVLVWLREQFPGLRILRPHPV